MNPYTIDMIQKEFDNLDLGIKKAITLKTFVSGGGETANQKAIRFIKGLKSAPKMDGETLGKFLSDETEFINKDFGTVKGASRWTENVGEFERSMYHAMKSMHITSDLVHGTPNPILDSFKKGLMTQPENYPVVANFSALAAAGDMDNQWMRVYQAVDLRGQTIGKIVDFYGEIQAYEVTDTQPLKYSNLGYDTATDVTKRLFGAGAHLDLDLINTNPAYTLNNAFVGIRAALERKKADIAFALMYDSASYNATTNYDTVASTVVGKDINTLNTAAAATLSALATAKLGINVTPQSVLYFICNPTYKARIDSALASVRGTDGTNPIVAYNIVPIYSYLMPSSPDGSNAGGILMLPGQKNMYAAFSDTLSNSEMHFDTQRMKVAGLEKYNLVVKQNKQNRYVKLA